MVLNFPLVFPKLKKPLSPIFFFIYLAVLNTYVVNPFPIMLSILLLLSTERMESVRGLVMFFFIPALIKPSKDVGTIVFLYGLSVLVSSCSISGSIDI